jgi:hypothetical protein
MRIAIAALALMLPALALAQTVTDGDTVIAHLTEQYPNCVIPGNKAVKIHGNTSGRRNADVLVCSLLRRYYNVGDGGNSWPCRHDPWRGGRTKAASRPADFKLTHYPILAFLDSVPRG